MRKGGALHCEELPLCELFSSKEHRNSRLPTAACYGYLSQLCLLAKSVRSEARAAEETKWINQTIAEAIAIIVSVVSVIAVVVLVILAIAIVLVVVTVA